MTDLREGDKVQYQGKDCEVFRVVGNYVGLIFPDKEPIFDEKNRRCAHVAVRKEELDG